MSTLMNAFKNKQQHLFNLCLFILITCCCNACFFDKSLDFETKYNFDIYAALEEAKKADKPLLIYFSAWACVNCKKMEERVLKDKAVVDYINEKYTFVTLYADDRAKLKTKSTWRKSWLGRPIDTNGRLNNYYQIALTRSGSQPIFAVVENDTSASRFIGYTPKLEQFLDFLKKEE